MKPKGFIIFIHLKVYNMRRDVFQAIADPTRREIISLIASEPLNINSVAEKFDISRAAIYKHLKILTECGLVSIQQQGRERYCQAKFEQLGEVSDWLEKYRQHWTLRLYSLENYLNELQSKNK